MMLTLKQQMAAKGLIPASEIANRAGVHIQTVYKWISAGKIIGQREAGHWYVQEVSLRKFIPHLFPR